MDDFFVISLCLILVYPDPDAIPVSSNRPRIDDNDVGKILPNLERLWDYKCNITRGRNISAMTWNRSNPVMTCIF